LVKQYKVLITTSEDWCITGKIADSTLFIWHTEWSRNNNRFGAGVYGPGDNHSEDIPIGSLYTDRRGREDTWVQGFGGGNLNGKRHLGRPSLRWENNIKIYGERTVSLRLRIGTNLGVVNLLISIRVT